MSPETLALIDAIHRSPGRCVLAMTGGGTGAAALLLSVPGGSRKILEVAVPYQERAVVEFLGRRPTQFCSVPTSRALAVRAYERAAWLAGGERVLGIGCTSSLATDRPKRGDHRFHLTCHAADRIETYSLILHKDARSREEEEAVLDSVLLNALAAACGVSERVPVALLSDESVHVETEAPVNLVSSLLSGKLPAFCASVDGQLSGDAPRPSALLPGAFEPVHEGHWGLAAAASRFLSRPVVFELSVINVDKPPLPAAEIRRRLQQFTWRAPLWITRAPTFADKAGLFPGVVFVVGADTAERIVAPRYYQGSEACMATALEHVRRQGCRFLVACRETIRLEDLSIPEAYRDLFSGIPKADFWVPTSSTALLEQAASAQPVAPAEVAG